MPPPDPDRTPSPATTRHVDTTPIHAHLRDGTPIVVRPLEPEDAALLVEGFGKLSAQTRYRRFLQAVDHLTPEQVAYLTHVDGYDHLAWGVTTDDPAAGHAIGIAIARSVREPADAEQAEFAIVVADEWQGKGVGAMLTDVLAHKAWQAGVRRWRGTMLASNDAVQRLMSRAGETVSRHADGHGTIELVVKLGAPA